MIGRYAIFTPVSCLLAKAGPPGALAVLMNGIRAAGKRRKQP
jgi:hypothetical protein